MILDKIKLLYIIYLEVECRVKYFKEIEMFYMANSLLHMNGVVWQKDNSPASENDRPVHHPKAVSHSLAGRAFDKLGDGLISLGMKLKEDHPTQSGALVSRI